MAKPQKATKLEDIELVPDAWPRFERFIKDAAKAGPQPKAKKPKKGQKHKANDGDKS